MRLPLNYAILQQFLFHDELCADQIYDSLANDYASHRQFKRALMEPALLTAMMSGLLEESRVEEHQGKVTTWYKPTEVGATTIRRFIGA